MIDEGTPGRSSRDPAQEVLPRGSDRPVSQLESCAMMPSASGPLAARVHKIVRLIPRPSVPEAPMGKQTRGMSRVK